MAGFREPSTQMRHPLSYTIDIMCGLHALGLRGTRRLMVSNTVMGVLVGAGVGGIGAGAVELLSMAEPQLSQPVGTETAVEVAGVVVGLGAVGGLLQGIHQVSKEGQAARVARREARRARRQAEADARRDKWLL